MAIISELVENFEGGSIGAVVSSSNTIFAAITGGSTATFVADAIQGSQSVQVQAVAQNKILRADHASVPSLWVSYYLKITAYPDTVTAIMNWYSATTKVGDLRLDASGVISVRDNVTQRWASTALALNQWHRIAVRITPGSATGHQIRIYSGLQLHTMTASQDSGGVTATAAAATTIDNIRLGLISNCTGTVQFDRLTADTAAEPAGLVIGAPLAVDAGQDQLDIYSYETVTLSGTLTGGTGPFNYQWQQTVGTPVVTLSGTGVSRTFTAPAVMPDTGASLTFQLTVTDATNATTSDTVVVTVQPHNEYTRTTGGVWQPYVIRNRSSGTWQ